MAFHLYSRGRATGPYLQNAPIFPTNLPPDIRWGFDAIWNVSIITTTTATFEYSLDGGVTWFALGTLSIGQELTANIKADDKDSFNLRCTDVAGCTVFRIVVSIAPEDIMRPLAPVKVVIPEPLQVDICPVTCDVPVDIQNQPISVTETEDPKAVSITGQPISVDVVSVLPNPLPVSITGQPISVTETADPKDVAITGQPISVTISGQPITVTQSANPLPVDICPVNCTIPVSITGQPISVTETADPKNVAITGQPIGVTITGQPISVDATIIGQPIGVSITGQPIAVSITGQPISVDICPVTCDVPVVNGTVTPLDVQVANALGTPVGGTRINITNSAYISPNDIFAAISPTGTSVGDSVMFRVQWSATDGGVLSYTLNDSDFVAFNDANSKKEDSSHVFDVVVDHGDSFTLQFEKDTTITFLRVVQLV